MVGALVAAPHLAPASNSPQIRRGTACRAAATTSSPERARSLTVTRTISPLGRFIRRISNPLPPHPSKRRQLMLLSPRNVHNVFDWKLPHQQSIRNQRPMAPPGHRLRAHNRRRFRLRELLQPPEPLQKLIRLHIVRKPTKAGIVPTQILRVRLRAPQPTQFFQMHVPNANRPQTPRQAFPIELRIVPRTRNTPHIHNAPHTMRPQNFDEFLNRPGRMPNRKNLRLHFLAPHAHKITLPSWERHSPGCRSAGQRTLHRKKYSSSINLVQFVLVLYHVWPPAQLHSNPFSATLKWKPKYEIALTFARFPPPPAANAILNPTLRTYNYARSVNKAISKRPHGD